VEWIDTHTHLFDKQFRQDLPAVLQRASETGVRQILAVGIDHPSNLACVDLARSYPQQLFATVGIQPNHVAECAATDWDEVVKLAQLPEVVGIGETGLDRYWDRTPFPQQEDFFARHLTLSRQTQKALVIHTRECDADILRMLREDFAKHGPILGVMHSFCSNAEVAKECLEMGLDISLAGMLTYKSAEDIRQMVKSVPLNRLLVETDCPYLAPVPQRGKRNEPSFVVHTGACLAECMGISRAEIAKHTTANARRLFKLPEPV
jgi:TatD DNase family protein